MPCKNYKDFHASWKMAESQMTICPWRCCYHLVLPLFLGPYTWVYFRENLLTILFYKWTTQTQRPPLHLRALVIFHRHLPSCPHLESHTKFGHKGKCLLSKMRSFLPSCALGVLSSLGVLYIIPLCEPWDQITPSQHFCLEYQRNTETPFSSLLYSHTSS